MRASPATSLQLTDVTANLIYCLALVRRAQPPAILNRGDSLRMEGLTTSDNLATSTPGSTCLQQASEKGKAKSDERSARSPANDMT